MDNSNQIEIPMSSLKLILAFLGSIGFVGAGAWVLYEIQHLENLSVLKQVLMAISGIVGILFFGFLGFLAIKKLRDKKPGLIISGAGVTDHSNAFSIGFIPWSDVVGVTDFRVFKQRFVSIDLKNPQEYIEKQDTIIKRMAMQFNQTIFGAPISISASALQCNHDKLKAMLKNYFSEYKKKKA